LAWLIHLIGDVHQPLHTAQLFTREYPNGDRGGNEICIRVAPNTAALDLHRLWDGLITSSTNTARLGKIATDLLTKFSRVGLREFEHKTPDAWAKESYEIATKIAYEIPGLNLTDDALRRKPNLKIELLFDPQALQKFKAAVDWVVQQIKK